MACNLVSTSCSQPVKGGAAWPLAVFTLRVNVQLGGNPGMLQRHRINHRILNMVGVARLLRESMDVPE